MIWIGNKQFMLKGRTQWTTTRSWNLEYIYIVLHSIRKTKYQDGMQLCGTLCICQASLYNNAYSAMRRAQQN